VRCKPGVASCELAGTQASIKSNNGYATNRLLACNADGSGTDTSQVCEADTAVCSATGKTCTRCTPNAFFCDGPNLQKCNADGSNFDPKETCTSADLCDPVAGACTAGDCKPGQFQCQDNGALQACGRDGKWAVIDSCPSKALCDASQGYQGGRCQQCATDGSSSCNGSDIQSCAYNNGQHLPYTLQSCAPNTCVSNGNYASCGACIVGTIQCSDSSTSYNQCTGAANQYTYNNICPTGQVCNPAAVKDATVAKCIGCIPGRFSCDQNGVLSKCKDDGSAYVVSQNCSTANLQCDAGRGACVAAYPGYYSCATNGDVVSYTYDMTKRDHSVISQVVQSCGSQNLCDQYTGSCRSGQCAVGQTTCNNGTVYTCDTGDFRRQTNTRCVTSSRCQDGFGCVKTLAIAAGDAHTCAVVAGSGAVEGDPGYVMCWGANESGQLGDGSPLLADSKEARPVLITNSDNKGGPPPPSSPLTLTAFFTGVCAGKNFTCADIAIDTVSTVACWGSNAKGQLGVNLPDPGPFNSPFNSIQNSTPPPAGMNDNGGMQLTGVTCGAEFACALGSDGAAWCWGANDAGQQGTGSIGTDSVAASPVDGHVFTQLSAGARHVCGIQADNTVWCWGANDSGQLGNGTTKGSASPVLVGKVSATSDRGLALGNDFSLALSTTKVKNPYAWGSNSFGQLGNGNTTSSTSAGPLSGLLTATIGDAGTIYSGSTAEHACARIGDTLQCWGANVFGEVGDKTTDNNSNPVLVFDGKTAATKLAPGAHSVAVGGRHTCAINANGDVMCWGANHRYQLGSAVLTPQRAPIRGY
jgi:alpha-tubulin suppressor-like RCC1 family protein